LLIGAGGLGSPLALYLAAAGVGRIGIVDFDVVDESNLQRQILHGTKDIGRPKLLSAKDRLHDINPHIHIDTYETMLRADNALEICKNYDIIIDGTDNFQTRYFVNDVVSCLASRMSTARFSALKANPPCSIRVRVGHAIAAYTLSRHHRGWSPRVRRVVSWAFCLGLLA
jgi:molybdopterin/thiamine biosynthesis adenylyltransferase